MSNSKLLTSKAELNRMAEIWSILQKLPEVEQIAILYYMKGRFDAGAADIEIPDTHNIKAS